MPNDAGRTGTPAGVFGAGLRIYRSRAGLSQKDVAFQVHVSDDVIRAAIQVIRAGGTHAGLLGGFIIADLDSKPSIAYLETAAEGPSWPFPLPVGQPSLSS